MRGKEFVGNFVVVETSPFELRMSDLGNFGLTVWVFLSYRSFSEYHEKKKGDMGEISSLVAGSNPTLDATMEFLNKPPEATS